MDGGGVGRFSRECSGVHLWVSVLPVDPDVVVSVTPGLLVSWRLDLLWRTDVERFSLKIDPVPPRVFILFSIGVFSKCLYVTV